ncbi:uncharacterized protein BDR25DRAFT_330199 [Lindgomyces ingoldianus]|uniref:Uncharacterized protein n=1 Tax=Lindgomyces ingoldianus TaxID=673940 RepID=A0ACB6RGC7_9PLEO|nr:uncharacterized protein BDR25DRAFT_330199 [Lindgomyces ingoldianus]KAF2477367.1 hypothetical protein BDR25DRAFT_330199 [Lindgomyces ingoldianus]
MTDYNRLTVANLRQLLKDRGIPSTGLTRKAQIIEKLEEQDQTNDAVEAHEEAPAIAQPDQTEPVEDAQDEMTEELEKAELPAPASEPAPATEDQEPPTVTDTTAEEQIKEQHPAVPSAPELNEEPVSISLAPEEQPTPSATPKEQSAPEAAEPLPGPAPSPREGRQAPDTDTPVVSSTPPPDPNEKPSVEKPELPVIVERSELPSVEQSRLNSEELEADTRKRKRRSLSPDIPTQDIKAKKPRPSRDAVVDVHLKEDEDTVMDQRPPVEVEEKAVEEKKGGGANGVGDTESPKAEPVQASPRPLDSREEAPQEISLPVVSPALHAATPALYIRNLMRPLKPDLFRASLISLATPGSTTPDPSILKTLFLDTIRTHAFALFTSINAASRARASLHNQKWPPNERNRQDLWVDFVPEDEVTSWIKTEEDTIATEKAARIAGRGISAKKFEVYYQPSSSGTIAVFQEVGLGIPGAPRGPKIDPLTITNTGMGREPLVDTNRRPSQTHAHALELLPAQDSTLKDSTDKPFQTLDSLFHSTTTKPKLYYLPVSETVARKRQDELDAETSRDWRPDDVVRGRGRGVLDQKFRYSFDGERLVEVGPDDRGPWSEGFVRGRGGWRGGGGGAWRGGGDGYRGEGYRGGGGFRGGRGWRG